MELDIYSYLSDIVEYLSTVPFGTPITESIIKFSDQVFVQNCWPDLLYSKAKLNMEIIPELLSFSMYTHLSLIRISSVMFTN